MLKSPDAPTTCIDPNEQAIDVAFESGETILQATHRAGVDGILAECGGGCSCATCHVILTSDWDGTLVRQVPGADMLSFAVDPTPVTPCLSGTTQ